MIKKILSFILVCFILLIGCTKNETSSSQTKVTNIRVMAAASLTEVFTEIKEKYEEKNHDINIELNFAGTQSLVNQIEEGIEADIFVSANISYMDYLTEKKLVKDSIIFAENELIIGINNENDSIKETKDLGKEGIKLAIADSSVPVGKYTLQWLDNIEKSGNFSKEFIENFMNNVVSHELDVKSIVSKIELGEVDAGIVYRTDILYENSKNQIRSVEIDDQYNVKVQYPIGLINESKKQEESKKFLEFILSDEGKAILQKYGFNTE
ncbi:molybdate ABC transporter substrate-binding protein [Defluviitalea phaphyphila]|uniref:molybdate ABC transporter substrate-binding protein n=1 Tax=Defluviitalea phaphyphila TaxID=1473580 RepID=UPI0007309A71|nr:molybdate ABC transporter substrate-binding protein [Defluviitalea phaphyphila]